MILTEPVSRYLAELHDRPDALLGEMQAHGRRAGVPIVVPETGALLHVLALIGQARRIVEVGTAIGVSTLYLARALPADGELVSFDIDPERQEAAAGYLSRAGVLDRVQLKLQDAREGLAQLEPSFDLAFIDGVKDQYGDYLDQLLPLLGPGAVLVVDNVLMSGAVAEGRGDGHWTDAQVRFARSFNERVLNNERLAGTLTPVGDGVLIAVHL